MNRRTVFAFALGLGIGLAGHGGAAQDLRLPGMNGINHIAFVATHYDEMVAFYTQTLGFSQAFTNKNAAGQPTLTYLQASRATFIELFPESATRKPGFSHFGIHVDDIHAVADRLRERGLQIAAPRVLGSGSITVTTTDPDGNSIELSELPPDAPTRRAMDAWK